MAMLYLPPARAQPSAMVAEDETTEKDLSRMGENKGSSFYSMMGMGDFKASSSLITQASPQKSFLSSG